MIAGTGKDPGFRAGVLVGCVKGITAGEGGETGPWTGEGGG